MFVLLIEFLTFFMPDLKNLVNQKYSTVNEK
jgi:hypothetical protein